MKISPIGIDAYRQANEKPQVENRQPAQKEQAKRTDTVRIPERTQKTGSDISVKLKPGSFSDMLSTEEKQALDILFEKYREIGAKQAAYSKNGREDKPMTGNFVDVKL